MAITVNTNSYVTLAEATAYFADKYGYDDWAAEPAKEGALISAAQHLDLLCSWYGYKCEIDQDMEFPRYSYPEADPTPQAIKDAQCEIAYNIVAAGSTSTDGGDPLASLKAGSVSLSFKANVTDNPLVNDLAIKLVKPYGLVGIDGQIPMVLQ